MVVLLQNEVRVPGAGLSLRGIRQYLCSTVIVMVSVTIIIILIMIIVIVMRMIVSPE